MEYDYNPVMLKMVPEHLRDGIQAYIETGRPVGQFLQAVLRNDLKAAVSHADDSSLAGMRGIIQFLYNYAPAECWGNEDTIIRWMTRGGIEGKQRKLV